MYRVNSRLSISNHDLQNLLNTMCKYGDFENDGDYSFYYFEISDNEVLLRVISENSYLNGCWQT